MQKTLFEPDATYYTVPEALNLFIPNNVWNEVRRPRHQLLYGGQGTGKTMLLKRLSWSAMLKQPEFLEGHPFMGFYTDMRDLAILRSLFLNDTPIKRAEALRVARLLAVVHLLDCLATTFFESSNSPMTRTHIGLQEAIVETANEFGSSLGLTRFHDAKELSSSIAIRKEHIISALGSPTKFQDLLSNVQQGPEPELLLRVFALALNRREAGLRIGILLDQYEYLPAPCRLIFNGLLKRENEPQFFSIFACRPFSFSPELSSGFIQPGEDFRFTVAEYFEGEYDSYEDLLSDIWSAIRPQGPRLSRLLEGGLKYFAALSSRSVRRFLELCEEAGALEATHSDFINKKSQRRAAESISRQARDQLKVASDVSPGSIWHLILRISEKSFQANNSIRSFPITAEFKTDDLLGFEYISEDGGVLLRKAFEEGGLQFATRRDASSLSIPDRCMLASILAPILKAEFSENVAIVQVNRDEVDQIAKGGPRIGSPEPLPKGKVGKIFLSISFADLPEPTIIRRLFHDVFEESGIRIIEGMGLGSASLEQIRAQLQDTDLTLMDLTHLRPNVIFEMGLTLGVSNRLVPILNRDSSEIPSLEPYPFLLDMGYLDYSFQPEAIRELREKVLAWADRPVDRAHLLERSTTRGIRLRVKQVPNTLAIYYPERKDSLWRSFQEGIRKIASSSGIQVYFVSSKPFTHDLTSLSDHLVWCISRSERIIVDTSGINEPDLYGAFALGFSYGSSKKGRLKEIIRLEEASVRYQGLSMWPSELYRRWRNVDHLFQLVRDFLPRRRRGGRR